MVRLGRVLHISDAETDATAGVIVIAESEHRLAGFLVDELLGQQQIVIKSLGDALQGLPGISGAAIMPDGQVGLILDVGGLISLARMFDEQVDAQRREEPVEERLAMAAASEGRS